MSGFLFWPSDHSDDAEYDESEMLGPEGLLFKHFGLRPVGPRGPSAHTLGQKATCPTCAGKGWINVIP